MQGLKRERAGGWMLIAAALTGVLVVRMHPTGHDLDGGGGDSIAHAAHLNRAIHGVAIGVLGTMFVGLWTLRRAVGGGDWSLVGCVAQAIGLMGGGAAAVASGFVATPLFEAMVGADQATRDALAEQAHFTHLWNQGFAKVYATAFAFGMVAWARALHGRGRAVTAAGWFGAVVGIVTLLAVWSHHLHLGVHGFGVVFGSQAVWMAWLGGAMVRGRP